MEIFQVQNGRNSFHDDPARNFSFFGAVFGITKVTVFQVKTCWLFQ